MKFKAFLPVLVLIIAAAAAVFFVYSDFKRGSGMHEATVDFLKNNELTTTLKNAPDEFASQTNPSLQDLSNAIDLGNANNSATSIDALLKDTIAGKSNNGNLTELFGLLMLKEMISSAENSKGTNTSSSMVSLDPNKILETFGQSASNLIENSWKDKMISEKDIKISADNSKKAISTYVNGGTRIMSLYFEETQNNPSYITDAIKKNDQDKIGILMKNFNSAISDFKNLTTPSSFSDFQIRQINLLIIQKTILEDIYNTASDPLKAYLAVEMFNDVLNQHRALISEMNQELLSLGIKI